jgi:hypothetical protein
VVKGELDWTVRRGWRRKISIKDRGGAMTKRRAPSLTECTSRKVGPTTGNGKDSTRAYGRRWETYMAVKRDWTSRRGTDGGQKWGGRS